MSSFKDYLSSRRELVEAGLDRYFPDGMFPKELGDSVRYSLLAGGKRVRPILTIAAAELFGTDPERVLPFACAIEAIHTYTLIHDDLPAMDDDDYRRGRLTNHKVFGEAMAILAGDALLTEAFNLMARESLAAGLPPKRALMAIQEIATRCGINGVIGGQAMDMLNEDREIDFPTLEYIHTHKTGALILASVRTGVLLSSSTKRDIDRLTEYGRCIGLAFQVMDDILDVEGSFEQLGKQTGMDAKQKKQTYPSVVGMKQAKDVLASLTDRAMDRIKPYGGRAAMLHEFARYLQTRKS